MQWLLRYSIPKISQKSLTMQLIYNTLEKYYDFNFVTVMQLIPTYIKLLPKYIEQMGAEMFNHLNENSLHCF